MKQDKPRWRHARLATLRDGTMFALNIQSCRPYVLVTRTRDGFIKYRRPQTIAPTYSVWQDRKVWVRV